ERAIRLQGAGVILAGLRSGERRTDRHRFDRRELRGSCLARAELAVPVRAPAPEGAVGLAHAAVLLGKHELFDGACPGVGGSPGAGAAASARAAARAGAAARFA